MSTASASASIHEILDLFSPQQVQPRVLGGLAFTRRGDDVVAAPEQVPTTWEQGTPARIVELLQIAAHSVIATCGLSVSACGPAAPHSHFLRDLADVVYDYTHQPVAAFLTPPETPWPPSDVLAAVEPIADHYGGRLRTRPEHLCTARRLEVEGLPAGIVLAVGQPAALGYVERRLGPPVTAHTEYRLVVYQGGVACGLLL